VVTIPAPTVTTHPSDETVCEGDQFTLTAAGNNVDSYQWYKNGTAISGATSASYTVSSATAGDAGSYYCELSNSCDVVNTNTATVTVNLQAVVTTHPQDVTVFVGNPFTLTSAGNNVTGYQWYFGGSPITGATSATYSVSSASAADAGDYYCELSNTCGSVNTNTATVTVNEPGSLVLAPTSFDAPASAGSTTVALTSNVNWSVSSVASWYSVSPMNGSGDATLTITYNENTSTTSRTDDFIVSGEGESATFTLNQDGATPVLSIDPTSITVSANAGNTSFGITSNESWSIETSDPEVTTAPSSGSGNQAINVSYPAINTMAGTTYTVTVTSGSGIVEVFTINQNGVSASITLSDYSQTVGSEAGSYSITVICPDDLSWTGIDGVFSSPSPNSGTGSQVVVINYEENTSPDSRVDVLTFSGSGVSADFTLTQVGAGAPLEASASSDKSEYFIGETIQLYGSATGGTGNYTYSWTGTGGFTSSLQNPTLDPTNVGTYTLTLIVNDGENTATDNVVVSVGEVIVVLESSTQTAEAGVPVHFTITVDGATVDEIIFETDGDALSGFVNPWEFDYTYQNVSGSPYDVEITVITTTGFVYNVSYPNYMDVITGINDVENNITKIYPNPTRGKLFIDAQERPEMVSIVNISGSEVLHMEDLQEFTQVDLSSLPNGLYFVRILSDGVLITHKVIKR
jgi:predicted secreted protein